MSDDERRSRDTCASAAGLLEAVLPFALEKGPSWCRYECEAKLVAKASLVKTGEKGVEGHHKLLAALRQVQPNLSFTSSAVKHVCKQLFSHENLKTDERFKMTEAEKKDYMSVMSCRVRNMCRVVAQAELKCKRSGKVADWVAQLPWNRGEAPATAPAAPAVAVAAPATASAAPAAPAASAQEGQQDADYSYKFDKELLLPIRFKRGQVHPDPGLPVDVESCRKAGKVTAE